MGFKNTRKHISNASKLIVRVEPRGFDARASCISMRRFPFRQSNPVKPTRPMKTPRPTSFLATSIASLLLGAVPAFADSVWTGASSLDWNNAANWSAGYPAATNAIVNPNAGAFPNPTILADAVTVGDIRVNDTTAGTATVNQTAGTITQTGWFRIATGAGGTGVFNMSGGTNNVTGGRVLVGENGTGTLNVSGGSMNFSGGEGFMLAANAGATGTVNQTGGVVNKTNGWFSIGGGGNGFYNISGGSLSATGDFNVADVGVSRGVLNVSGTATVNSTGTLFLGKNAGTTGLLNVSAGTVNSNLFTVGGGNNATNVGSGFATVTGGQVNASGELWVGQGGNSNGLMNLSGGVVATNSWFAVGRQANSYGVLNISGTGTARMTAGASRFFIIGSLGGTGVVNMTGGTLEAPNGGDLRLSEGGTGSGTLNLGGGIVKVDRIVDNGATSYLYLNGGVLQPRMATTQYLEGLDSAIVGPGGAIFDTNGNNVTVNQTLSAPTGAGVTSIPVTSGGTAYAAQPIIKITGDGVGASAIANMSGGVITGITITNPGTGYTTASVSVVESGSTAAATLGAPVIGANVTTGGLTKLGNGTLTIGTFTNNDYTGPTTITAGTLSVGAISDGGFASSLGASPSAAANLVFNGGALQYTGGSAATNRNFTINSGKTALVDVSTLGTVLTLTGGSAATNGGLTKIGDGTLSLAGAFAHTGTTSANGGVLAASGAYPAPFAVNAGGHLTALDAATGTLTVPALALNAGSFVDFELNFGATLNAGHDLITISGTNGLTLTNTGLNLYQTGGTTPFTDNGTYTLFDYTGTLPLALNSFFSIANSQVGKVYGLINNTAATTIELTISTATAATWITNGSGSWPVAANWAGGIVPNGQGAIATFGSAITAPATVSVNGPKVAGVIIFDNANSYTLSGGAGDVITLNNGFGTPLIQQLQGNHTVSAPIVLASSSNAAAFAGTTLTLSGNISGAGNFSTTDLGTVLLTGTNSYAATNVNAGTLAIGDGGTTGSLGSGPVSTGTGALLVINRSNNLSLANAISGAGALTHAGTGTITYTGSASYTGATILSGPFVNDGTINGTSSITAANTSLKNTGTVTAGGVAVGVDGGSASFEMSAGTLTIGGGGLKFSDGAAGTVSTGTITGGTISSTGELWVSNGLGNTSQVNISAGSVSASNWIAIGRTGGAGEVNLTGGSLNKTNANGTHIIIGSLAALGTLNQSGTGTLTSANDVRIGENDGATRGDGSLWNMTGGTATVGGTINVAWRGATAEWKLSAGNVTAGRLAIGSETAGSGDAIGTMTMTGGTLNLTGAAGESRIGGDNNNSSATSQGTLNLSGGAITTASNFQIGAFGVGTLNMSGGTLVASMWPVVGRFAGSNGLAEISGGTFTHTNPGTSFIIGEDGVGVLRISGTGTVDARSLRIGHTASGNGTVDLDAGGTLITRFIQKSNAGAAAQFNFNGGLLKASDNAADFFIGMPDGSLIVESTANIDTNGFAITISQSLITNNPGVGIVKKLGAGTLNLTGFQDYATLDTEGGRTNLANTLGSGSSSIIANAETNTNVDQTLASLTIGPGTVFTIGDLPPPAPPLPEAPLFAEAPAFAEASSVGQAVPEPGTAALLLSGLAGLLGLRRRRG